MNAAGAPIHAKGLIGAILVEAGRLKLEDAERVLLLQRGQGLRFGDAALRLGLVTAADIAFALASQYRYPCLVRGESAISEKLAAAYSVSGPEIEVLRTLRSQLTLRWFNGDPSRRALAVVGAARNEGCSFVAANLAVMFSRFGERTLLIDADMRHPGQHELFGLDNRVGLSTVLAGRAGQEAIQRIPALPDISVLPAGPVPPNPRELLARPLFPQLLGEFAQRFDVVLLDTSTTAGYTDAHTVAQRAGAALLVARKNLTRISPARELAEAVTQMGAVIVGAVLTSF